MKSICERLGIKYTEIFIPDIIQTDEEIKTDCEKEKLYRDSVINMGGHRSWQWKVKRNGIDFKLGKTIF